MMQPMLSVVVDEQDKMDGQVIGNNLDGCGNLFVNWKAHKIGF